MVAQFGRPVSAFASHGSSEVSEASCLYVLHFWRTSASRCWGTPTKQLQNTGTGAGASHVGVTSDVNAGWNDCTTAGNRCSECTQATGHHLRAAMGHLRVLSEQATHVRAHGWPLYMSRITCGGTCNQQPEEQQTKQYRSCLSHPIYKSGADTPSSSYSTAAIVVLIMY